MPPLFCQFVSYVVLALCLAGSVFAQAPSQSPQEIEAQLKLSFEKQILTIRHFYPGKKLEYNADGELPDGKPGNWLGDGIFQLTKVELQESMLRLEGERLYVKFDAIKPEFSFLRSGKKVLITLPIYGTPSGELLSIPLDHIFYRKTEKVVGDLPPEIQDLLNRKRDLFTPAGERVYTLDADIQPPKLVKKPKPDYPTGARIARIQGTVVLSVVVNTDGRTSDIKVISGHPMLEQPVVEAVRNWTYQPATRNGVPVPVLIAVDVQFDLR